MNAISTRQFYPALDSATESALRASIERFGVLVPVVVDQFGELIDGHHRSRIAGELGIEFSTVVREVADSDEARELARTLNEDRRMLSREQRLPVVVALREDGHSYRAIGGALGVDPKTAYNDMKTAGVERSTPEPVTGLDGKTYPATRPAGRPVGTKSVPLSLDTDRQRQIASTAKERIERAVGTCNGIARGFDHLNVEAAALQTSEEELNGWQEALRDAKSAISRLQSRLKEVPR